MPGVRIGSALSTHPGSAEAAREELAQARVALDGKPPQFTVLFHSPHHLPRIEAIAEMVAADSSPGAVIGCTAQAVVGGSQEVEEGPALSLWTAYLGEGVAVESFAVASAETEDGATTLGMPAVGDDTRAVILLGDPYSFPGDAIEQLNQLRPGLPIIGGMASGGRGPGRHALVLGSQVRMFGGVGVTVSGDVVVETVVSQGCKPIGSAYVVTGSERNLITSLAGAPPLERVRELFSGLSDEDRLRAQRGLHIGVVIDEYEMEHGPGSFLIRNVIGADEATGAVAVGDEVKVGQTVRFHIRDAEAADEDLRGSLGVLQLTRAADPSALAGALLFTCNGRGRHLFGSPNHDVGAVEDSLGRLPVAGMFCAGEIGPVGGQNFLHGFTASMALFAPGAASQGGPLPA